MSTREYFACNFYVMPCMVSSCQAKFFVTVRSVAHAAKGSPHASRGHLKEVQERHAKKWWRSLRRSGRFTCSSNYCERFEPKRHFISRLSMIVRVNLVLNRNILLTVTDVSTTCAVVIFRVKVSCITPVDGIKLWLLTRLVN